MTSQAQQTLNTFLLVGVIGVLIWQQYQFTSAPDDIMEHIDDVRSDMISTVRGIEMDTQRQIDVARSKISQQTAIAIQAVGQELDDFEEFRREVQERTGDRFTESDHRSWTDRFFDVNPGLKRPEDHQ